MKEIVKIFDNKKIRCFIKNKELYFSMTDICKALNLTNVSDTLKVIEIDYIDKIDVTDSLGRNQNIYIVNEAGLYQIIFRSKKKEAVEFKKWVFEDVLPSIRKTGKYSIPEEIKKISTNNRNALTSEWKNHGIKEPQEYIKLTLNEYKLLDIKNKKKFMTKREILMLSALESMESFRLFENENINGYIECNNNLVETSLIIKGAINEITQKTEEKI